MEYTGTVRDDLGGNGFALDIKGHTVFFPLPIPEGLSVGEAVSVVVASDAPPVSTPPPPPEMPPLTIAPLTPADLEGPASTSAPFPGDPPQESDPSTGPPAPPGLGDTGSVTSSPFTTQVAPLSPPPEQLHP